MLLVSSAHPHDLPTLSVHAPVQAAETLRRVLLLEQVPQRAESGAARPDDALGLARRVRHRHRRLDDGFLRRRLGVAPRVVLAVFVVVGSGRANGGDDVRERVQGGLVAHAADIRDRQRQAKGVPETRGDDHRLEGDEQVRPGLHDKVLRALDDVAGVLRKVPTAAVVVLTQQVQAIPHAQVLPRVQLRVPARRRLGQELKRPRDVGFGRGREKSEQRVVAR
mmetsp:Transcript_23269/g.81099  ORF Transcript_23269/g.81099 Transcript_23269/m.81099 type:complete len:222 (+) Transcript_23269:2076-2741(+)